MTDERLDQLKALGPLTSDEAAELIRELEDARDAEDGLRKAVADALTREAQALGLDY